MKKNKKFFPERLKRMRGFTMIEAMVVVFIVSLVAVTFFSVFSLGSRHIVNAKNRLGAVSLANEKMETVRNLNYEDIGTKKDDGAGGYLYGIPAGEILEEELVTRDNREYAVYTLVQYVDDSYDGIEGESPNDDIPTDYKKVRIKVSWNLGGEQEDDISLVSTFVPAGMEQGSAGGTLSLNIIDNQGVGIPQASVHLYNPDEGVDVVVETDNTGNISFPGAPEGDNYQIEVAKSGYYSVRTYDPYPISYFYPVDVPAAVLEGRLNVKSIITDRYSSLTFKARDPFGNTIPSLNFGIKGGKKIGDTDAETPEAVFDFDVTASFNSSGEKTFSERSFGEYYFEAEASDDFYFLQLDNEQNQLNEIDLPPDTNLEVNAIYAEKSVNSLLVNIFDGNDGGAISGAQVKLTRSDISFETTLVSDQYGQAFFPTALPELEAGEYQLSVEAIGYQNFNKTVEINNFSREDIDLTQN